MAEFFYAASAQALNLARLEEEVTALAQAGVDELYFPVRDGDFAPGFGFGWEVIAAVKACSELPCHAHLMVRKPERVIDRFAAAGCETISVHLEATPHSHRALGQIRQAGAKSGLALNPATPLVDLQYLLSSADRLVILSVEPGAKAAAPPKSSYDRVRLLREHIDYYKQPVVIEVAGLITAQRAAQYAHFGATRFVLGEEALGQQPGVYARTLEDFHATFSVERKRV